MSGRVLIVSNRLPITLSVADGELRAARSSGGLATGLASMRGEIDSVWIGYPGDLDDLPPDRMGAADVMLSEEGVVPVHLTRAQVEPYYEGFSNGVLWPAFHYLLDRVNLDAERDFTAYREVNERFADVVAETWREGDLVWVHDYHLMLLPGMLRARLPTARIGYFLHVPFPSSEIVRMLPRRRELLQGLLGADLIGFHASSYARHFLSSVLRVLDVESDIERLEYEGRLVHVGAFPMGIDAARFARVAAEPAIDADAEAFRRDNGGVPLLLGVDRLDYTKGLLRRIVAIDRLLEREPELRGRFRLLQVVVPSRAGIEAYDQLLRQIDEAVGRVNGRHATLDWSPIQYVYRSVTERELVALYRAAAVMVVTPLRDGMNLVAKEFVACRVDEDGVLVLSEFAGAAAELGSGVIVNPYDVDAMASALQAALAMPLDERQSRMRALRERVLTHDITRWTRSFLARLETTSVAPREAAGHASGWVTPESLAATIREAQDVVIVLDYDGTLVPIVATPRQACPDAGVLRLLRDLSARNGFDLHVASGRDRKDLEAWLGELDVGLHAEHGLWTRDRDGGWSAVAEIGADWKSRVRRILDEITERVPGSLVEEKSAGLAWHYRLADPEFASLQARELRLHLREILSNSPVAIMRGHKLVEIRRQGVHKGLVVERILAGRATRPLIVAIGDDATDEDLFAALGTTDISVRVGTGSSCATHRLRSQPEVLQLLSILTA